MTHGTRIEMVEGRLTSIVDRTGCVHASLRWRGDELEQLEVAGAIVHGAVISDPLLGAAHAIDRTAPAGRATTMTALAWPRPAEIPAVAAPAALPPGAGGAILNTIAVLAAAANVPALRYAGPYPTAALWTTLQRSFRTTGGEQQFTRDLLGRAARLARDPIEIDLTPAPHERLAITRGHVELRDGVERLVIDGASYARGGSPTRLIDDVDGTLHAEVWFGDARWSRVATIDPRGALIDGPHAVAPCGSPVVGAVFPPELCAALAPLIADAVPAPLARGAGEVMTSRAVRWADLGAWAARADADGLAVHAALWERIAPRGLARLALALAEALAPVVAAMVVAELTAAAAR